MKDSAKTEKQAIKVLQSWIDDTNVNFSNTVIEPCETECECGETPGMMASIEENGTFAVVSICDCCGNNDQLYSDLLDIN